jgi:hypothetical protein
MYFAWPNQKYRKNYVMKTLNLTLGLFLSLAANFTHALPVSTEDVSGLAGAPVTVVLHETNLQDPIALLFGPSISVKYDPSLLTYISGVGGLLTPAPALPSSPIGLDVADVDTVNGMISVSLAFPGPYPSGASGSLLELMFTINGAAAPGTTTTVDFSCLDFGSGCIDYPFNPVQATVTVLPPAVTPMPLPGTLPLMGLGLAALLWARRQRH